MMLGENKNTIKENKEALLEAITKVGLEVNTVEAKYMGYVSHTKMQEKITH